MDHTVPVQKQSRPRKNLDNLLVQYAKVMMTLFFFYCHTNTEQVSAFFLIDILRPFTRMKFGWSEKKFQLDTLNRRFFLKLLGRILSECSRLSVRAESEFSLAESGYFFLLHFQIYIFG